MVLPLDEQFYSRQLYVIGDDAMKTVADTSVLLQGMGGLGAEIAKNLVLMGVKQLAITDNKTVTNSDMGLNWFISETALNCKNRAEGSILKLQELNSYVSVTAVENPFTNLKTLMKYDCVILTELPLSMAQGIDSYCYNHSIKIIIADVYGVFSWAFCNFSPHFVVNDTDGIEPKEIMIANITDIIRTVNGVDHELVTGDLVTFSYITGMELLNGTFHKVQVISPAIFTIEALANKHDLGVYQRGGICKKLKTPQVLAFETLEKQLYNPSIIELDCSKNDAFNDHLVMLTIHGFQKKYNRLPHVQNLEDATKFISLAEETNKRLKNPIETVNKTLLTKASYTASGQLPALSAFLGGFVAQETIKAITGKFTPLKQWLHLNASEVCDNSDSNQTLIKNDRYDAIRACLGETCLMDLANSSLFLVGCGAIGCEMLKNCALLGTSTLHGKITITDHDLIEKSNLNRQFLFRSHHICKPKSLVAAESILQINPSICVVAKQLKVCYETEQIYSEDFLKLQSLVINALDNIESRQYMDRRCVSAQSPLLESGIMGCKGHVQVIIPNCTETYTAQSDPTDDDYPYCTIKSFPYQIEHTAQWAKEKFYSMFEMKPNRNLKFWSLNPEIHDVIKRLNDGEHIENIYHITRDMKQRPSCFLDCVKIARHKFEKYFNHKAKNLLHLFPENTLIENGKNSTLFWQSPRRPPTPIQYDETNELHLMFVSSTAKLLARIWNITFTDNDTLNIPVLMKNIEIPSFNLRLKCVVTDESVVAPDPMQIDSESEDLSQIANDLQSAVQDEKSVIILFPQRYDKDVDDHLDFVHSASNLRAIMYSLQACSRSKIKRITGRIIPAIASTTSVIAGLATIELIKVLKGIKDRKCYQNWFMNLAINSFIASEPAAPQEIQLGPNIRLTVWDRWSFNGDLKMSLANLIKIVKDKCSLNVSMVLQGTKIVWMPILPSHNARLKKDLGQLLDFTSSTNYVDLSMTFEVDHENDVVGPPIRLNFSKF